MSFEEENIPNQSTTDMNMELFTKILKEEFTDKDLEGKTYIQALEQVYTVRIDKKMLKI